MIWQHYHSLLASTAVAIVLIITRPDFEGWQLALPILAGGGGTTIIIQLGRRRRAQSKMLDNVDEEIEAQRRQWKFQKEVESHQLRPARWIAIIVILVVTLPILGVVAANPETMEVVKRWMGLFGCSC